MTTDPDAILLDAARDAPPTMVEAAARVLRAGSRPAQTAFLARAMNALARLAPAIDERNASDAAGATSDFSVLLAALRQPESIMALQAEDPLAPARLRGLEAKERLLQAEGGTVAVGEVANLLGISRQAVDKRRRAGRLIGLAVGRRGYRYPAWQFCGGEMLPGLDQVLAELAVNEICDPWTWVIFMLNPHTRLDNQTPLAALRDGQVEPVRSIARWYLQQVAE